MVAPGILVMDGGDAGDFGNPPAGKFALWWDTLGTIYLRDSSGVDTVLSAGLWVEAELETTTGVEQQIATLAMPEGSTIAVVAVVAGYRSDGGGDGEIVSKISGAFRRRTGGSATSIGSPTTNVEFERTDGGGGSYNVDFDTSGNDIQISVTGAGGHTVQWKARYMLVEAS